jgi:hypothetical protein
MIGARDDEVAIAGVACPATGNADVSVLPEPVPRPRKPTMPILAKLTIVGSAALLAAASPVAAASAKETIIGSPCAATGASPAEGGTILPLSLGTNHNNRAEAFFAEAPHGGLLTSWTVVIGYETKPFLLKLSVAGKVGDRHRYYIAQQTEPKMVKRGVNVFHTRLWIVKGETIALASVGGDRIPYCSTTSVHDTVGISHKGLDRDESGSFGPALGKFMIPAAAVLEPDNGVRAARR